MRLNNFTLYTPVNPSIPDPKAKYLRDGNGLDWYEAVGLFTKNYLLAIHPETNEFLQGVSRALGKRLWPEGLSVVETDELPENFVVGTQGEEIGCIFADRERWVFNGKKLVPRVPTPAERLIMNQELQRQFFQAAEFVRVPLQCQYDLGDTSPELLEKLTKVRLYIVKLSKLNLKDKALVWPELEY